MDDHNQADLEAPDGQLVLDRIRPTVVIRRRAVEATPSHAPPEEPRPVAATSSTTERRPSSSTMWLELEAESLPDDDDIESPEGDAAPDSEEAGAVARDDEPSAAEGKDQNVVDDELAYALAPPAPARKRIPVGSTTVVSNLAAALGSSPSEVASELVSRGFFEVTPRSTVSREIARVAASAFGYEVEDSRDRIEASAVAPRVRPRAAPPRKRSTKAKRPIRKAKPAKVRPRARGARRAA